MTDDRSRPRPRPAAAESAERPSVQAKTPLRSRTVLAAAVSAVATAAVVLLITRPWSTDSSPSTAPTQTATRQISVAGFVTLSGGNSYSSGDPKGSVCWASSNSHVVPSPSPFGDIKEGAQVVVSVDGKTVGLGTLSGGRTITAVPPGGTGHPDCRFAFVVAGVPSGQRFYKITAGHHSLVIPGTRIEHHPDLFFGGVPRQ